MINKLNKLGLGSMVEEGVERLDPLRGARASSAGEGGSLTLRHARRRRKVQSAGNLGGHYTILYYTILYYTILLIPNLGGRYTILLMPPKNIINTQPLTNPINYHSLNSLYQHPTVNTSYQNPIVHTSYQLSPLKCPLSTLLFHDHTLSTLIL